MTDRPQSKTALTILSMLNEKADSLCTDNSVIEVGSDPLPVPNGWEPPSNDLIVAQQQYVSAAQRAEMHSELNSSIVSSWRDMVVRPMAVDALLMVAHLVLRAVVDDLSQDGRGPDECPDCLWVLHPSTARLALAYGSGAVSQDVALTEFISWSFGVLQAGARAGDSEAIRLLSNLAASELCAALDGVVVGRGH